MSYALPSAHLYLLGDVGRYSRYKIQEALFNVGF